MTFRAKPLDRRKNRPGWDHDGRRNLYLNLGFGLIVVLAVVILVGAYAANYYGQHFAALATVNGQDISKDAYSDRLNVELFRYDHAESRTRELMNRGLLTQEQGQQRISIIGQQKEQLLQYGMLEQLVDERLQGQLATQRGIEITDALIDEQIKKDSTIPELRHAWMITVTPEVSQGATEATAEQIATARAKADQALADIKGGKSFEDVAKATSGDAYAEKGGDLGYIGAEGSLDGPWTKALFAAPDEGLTDVITGDDGAFRIGRVTEIVPTTTDDAYEQRAIDAGVNKAAFRDVIRSEVAKDQLDRKVLAEVVDAASPQRHVLEMVLLDDPSQPVTGEQLKISHILYSPNDDPSKAASLDAADPAWAKAEVDAKAALEKLKAGTVTLADLAKAESDDTSKDSGGDLGWLTRTDLASPQFDEAFATAVLKQDVKDGEVIGPVKSAFGYHLITVDGRRPPPAQRIEALRTEATAAGADFAAIARKESEGAEADKGGDIGWVARYQLERPLEEAIFALNDGETSGVVIGSDGYHLFKVIGVETRLPDKDQADTLRATAFDTWYAIQKGTATITRAGQADAGN